MNIPSLIAFLVCGVLIGAFFAVTAYIRYRIEQKKEYRQQVKRGKSKPGDDDVDENGDGNEADDGENGVKMSDVNEVAGQYGHNYENYGFEAIEEEDDDTTRVRYCTRVRARRVTISGS